MFCGTFDAENSRESLRKALSLLNFNEIEMIAPFEISLKEIVMSNVNQNHTEIIFDGAADFFYLSKEDARKLEPAEIPDLKFKPLEENHATLIDDYWDGRSKGSIDLIKNLIRFNDNLGAFNESGELVAWILKREYGTVGMLYVLDSQRSMGLGSKLTKNFVKLLGDKGMDSTVSIFSNNSASNKIFFKLGFKKIGENFRCGIRQK